MAPKGSCPDAHGLRQHGLGHCEPVAGSRCSTEQANESCPKTAVNSEPEISNMGLISGDPSASASPVFQARRSSFDPLDLSAEIGNSFAQALVHN